MPTKMQPEPIEATGLSYIHNTDLSVREYGAIDAEVDGAGGDAPFI